MSEDMPARNNDFEIENGELKRYRGQEEKVILPDGIRKIGRGAFRDCIYIKDVTIPEGVIEIGEAAFSNCGRLERVTIRGTMEKIGSAAFSKCGRLKNVSILSAVRIIGNGAFENCRSLSRVIIPEGLEEICGNAFRACIRLTHLYFPDSLAKIGEHAFSGCRILKPANEPDCVPLIAENAFEDASPAIEAAFKNAARKRIVWESSYIVTIKTLRRHKNADNLLCADILGNNVITDDKVRAGQRMVFFPVGSTLDRQFAEENGLFGRRDENGRRIGGFLDPRRSRVNALILRGELSEGLLLPVEALSRYAEPENLKEDGLFSAGNGRMISRMTISGHMDISDGDRVLKKYHDNRTSPGILYIPWGVEEIRKGAFMHCSHITEVVIPGTLEIIGERAFYDCPNLKRVRIPETVTEIGSEAFANCGRLQRDLLPEKWQLRKEIFTSRDFSITNGILKRYKGEMRNVVLPEGITEIGDRAFSGINLIESVIIPPGVTKIGYAAFEDCRKLKRVTIPDGVKEICEEAFLRCTRLQEITIPASVDTIGRHALGEYFYYKYDARFPYEVYGNYKHFRIRCAKGSAAERYAAENHLTYCFL